VLFRSGGHGAGSKTDLLYCFGAFLTVCRMYRNDAEKRVRQMAANVKASAPASAMRDAAVCRRS
jgi:hypothetical protein